MMHAIVALWLAVASQRQKIDAATAMADRHEYAKCRDTLAPVVETATGDERLMAFSQLGSCIDELGDHDKAIATFRRGLAIAPNDATLNFNLGLSLMRRKDLDGARVALERSLRAYPHQRDAMFLLGMAFEEQNYRVQAILAYLRFLAMEPSTERSQMVAHKTIALLNSGGPKPERRPAEGDYGPAELLLTLADEPDRDLDTLQREVISLLNVIYDPQPDATSFTGQVNAPFFKELVDRQLVFELVAIAFSSVAPAGSKEWIEGHDASVQKAIDFINERNQ